MGCPLYGFCLRRVFVWFMDAQAYIQEPILYLAGMPMDIINSGLETEQPIRVQFYYLTWWTWCLAPPLQCLDTRSSREIHYGDFFGYLKTAFYSGGLGVSCRHLPLEQNIVCTMSMEFQSPALSFRCIIWEISDMVYPGLWQQKCNYVLNQVSQLL